MSGQKSLNNFFEVKGKPTRGAKAKADKGQTVDPLAFFSPTTPAKASAPKRKAAIKKANPEEEEMASLRTSDKEPISIDDDEKGHPPITSSARSTLKRKYSPPPPSPPPPSSLPPPDDLPKKDTSVNSKKSYMQNLKNRTGPSAPGSKVIPEGAPNCLRGLTFVVTGELSSIDRLGVTELIRKYGGRVTGAVSGKTTYLVVGEKDIGESKVVKAKSLGTTEIDEDTLFSLIGTLPPQEDDYGEAYAAAPPSPSIPAKKKRKVAKIEDDEDENFISADPVSAKAAPTKAASAPSTSAKSKRRATKIKSDEDEDFIPADPVSAKAAPAKTTAPKTFTPRVSTSKAEVIRAPSIWTEKYAPQTLNDICGNRGMVKGLVDWLQTFQPHQKDGPGKERAVLISGPPGIGKSTAARIAAKEAGYRLWEMNASDSRNQVTLKSVLGIGTRNRSVEGDRVVLVMDEVDGMSSGDRGGMTFLIQSLRTSLIPIICICNDRQSPKIRSLANHCRDLRFRRPDATSLRSRIMSIAYREKVRIPVQVVDSLVAASHSDVRLILNTLSLWAAKGQAEGVDQTMSWDQGKTLGDAMDKHILLGPFDVTPRLFSQQRAQASLDDRIGYYFMDMGLVPLMVQENYLRTTTHSLEALSAAADSIADADIIDTLIHGTNQHWSLAPVHAVLSTVAPPTYLGLAGGRLSGKIEFAGYLGKMSKAGRRSNLLKQIHLHSSTLTSASCSELRKDGYVSALSQRFLSPLMQEGQAAIPSVLSTMDHYHISRDDLEGLGELLLSPPPVLPTSVKSALTRAYNKLGHRAIVIGGVSSAPPVTPDGDVDLEEVAKDDGAGEEEEEKEEEDKDEASSAEVFKVQKKGKAAAKGKAATKGKAAVKGRAAAKGKASAKTPYTRDGGRGRGKASSS